MKRSKPTDFGKPDAENPEWTKADFARARRDPALAAAAKAGKIRYTVRRAPTKTPTQERVTLPLDRDVLAFFKGTGTGWQARVNTILKAVAEAQTR